MKRTKLADRQMPVYTKGEEIFNMTSHIVGGALGILAIVLCAVFAGMKGDVYGVVAGCIFGATMLVLYTSSSIYHGLKPETFSKRVFQVIDHCTIFILIAGTLAGTYTPIALTSLREYNTALGWSVFGVVWGVSALGITLNAIDLKKYNVFSIICYLAQGWCIILTGKTAVKAIGTEGFLWLLAGGIAYTIGAVLYGIAGKKTVRYMHSVFHIFVVLGSILQFFAILFYVLV